jgi:hypothetical protein
VLQLRPREWWRQKPQHPLPQDVAAAAHFTGGGSAAGNDEGAPWTAFNDSAMAQIFSHDVAWMMEREVRFLMQCPLLYGTQLNQQRHPLLAVAAWVCIAACQSWLH